MAKPTRGSEYDTTQQLTTTSEPELFARKPSFASRARSFIGEVLTGKVKPAEPAPSMPFNESRYSPPASRFHTPTPVLSPEQQRKVREKAYSSDLYAALKELLDGETGLRRVNKSLWQVEEHLKLSVTSLNDMRPRMLREAEKQLSELVDYSENQRLWNLRDLLLRLGERGGPETVQTEDPDYQIPHDPPRQTARPAARVAAPPRAVSVAPPPPASPQALPAPIVMPSRAFAFPQAPADTLAPAPARSRPAPIPLPIVTEVADDMDAYLAPDMVLEQPEVLEAHGLEPFVAPPKRDFDLGAGLDMNMPSLRKKV